MICSLKTEQNNQYVKKNRKLCFSFKPRRFTFWITKLRLYIVVYNYFKLFWRVRSWLRTNAGGVPNTCKSSARSGQSPFGVCVRGTSGGWVSRSEERRVGRDRT